MKNWAKKVLKPVTSKWDLKNKPWYTSWIDESLSWKKTVYIGDWSFLTKVMIKGPDSLKLFSDISVNSFTMFEIGQAKHVIQCNNAGKVLCDGILMRIGDKEFLFEAGPFAVWPACQLQTGQYKASAELISGYNFQVSGPQSSYLFEQICGENMRDIKFMHFRKIQINGIAVSALRQGMAGEIGYELQGPISDAQVIYSTVLEAGKEFGIRQLGSRAFAINHLEACFPTSTVDYMPAVFGKDMAGYRDAIKIAIPDFFETHFKVAGSHGYKNIKELYRSPVELGWAKNIKFDHQFRGRSALEKEMASPKRTVVTLVWNSGDVIDVYASLFRQGQLYDYMEMPRNGGGLMYADIVLKDGKQIGVTTSRGYSVYFRQMISLCTIDIDYCEPGTEVTVVWGDTGHTQKQVRAKVAQAPYKKDNRRMDVTAIDIHSNEN